MFSGHRPGLMAVSVLLLMLASHVPFPAHAGDIRPDIDAAIVSAAARYGVDPDILRAIAMVESELDPAAVGDQGKSHGLFQINNFWLRKYGIPEDVIYDPALNAQWGAFVLSRCLDRYADHFWRAIGCYNTGAGDKSEAARSRYA